MGNIEFLGVPGVGKTSLYSSIDTNGRFHKPPQFGDTVLGNVNSLPVVRWLLSRVKTLYWQTRVREEYFKRHVGRQPESLKLFGYLAETVETDWSTLSRRVISTVARYELANQTKPDDGVVLLDEGFAQLCLSAYRRYPSDEFSESRYFEFAPVPDVIVHVDAPSEVCWRRQVERRDETSRTEWIDEEPIARLDWLRDRCNAITAQAAERGATIHYTESTTDIDEVATALEADLTANLS